MALYQRWLCGEIGPVNENRDIWMNYQRHKHVPKVVQSTVTPKGTSRMTGDHPHVIWLQSTKQFLRYAPETKLLIFSTKVGQSTVSQKDTSRVLDNHPFAIWLQSTKQLLRYMSWKRKLRHLDELPKPQVCTKSRSKYSDPKRHN